MLLSEQNLRPTTLKDFIGQDSIKQRLEVMLESSKIRGEPLDHILFSGAPGLGKTTLASLLAKELGVDLHPVSAPTLTKVGDIAKILTLLQERDILFIDEIHRLSRTCEEMLYSAMEDQHIDIVLGEGITARSIRISLQPFTLIGATTRSGYLSSPLRSRFGMEFNLSFYTEKELSIMIQKNAKILNLDIPDEVAYYIAGFCRMTPREAIRILKRIRDYAIVENVRVISIDFVDDCFRKLGIYRWGINEIDKKILIVLEKYGSPVGIKTISSLLEEEERTILENHEPFLLKIGLIEKTPRGRILTEKGIRFLQEQRL